MRFDPGDRVKAAVGGDERVGTVVRVAREQRIETLNQGLVEMIRTYMVRWPMPNGAYVTSEAAEAYLRLATAAEVAAADA